MARTSRHFPCFDYCAHMGDFPLLNHGLHMPRRASERFREIMSAPAGWHPQEDGRERFWDGTQWTDQFRPGQQGQVLAAPQPRAMQQVAPKSPGLALVASFFIP